MNRLRNIYGYLLAACCFLLLSECTRRPLLDDMALNDGEIRFKTELGAFSVAGDGAVKSLGTTELKGGPTTLYLHAIESDWNVEGNETKASPYTAVPSTMRLSGYSFSGAWSDSNLPNLFCGVTLAKGAPYWSGLSPRVSWPGASYKVRFAGIAPAAPTGATWSQTSSAAGMPSIGFTVQDAVASQVDLLECVSIDYAGDGSAARSGVALPFNHALTAIKFKTNNFGIAGTVKSVTIEGVYNSGSHTIGTSTWSSPSGSATYSVTVNQAFAASGETSVISGANTLLLLPQTCPSAAKLTVSVTIAETDYDLVASLSGQVWTPGKEITYTISPSSADWKPAVIEISSVPESVESGVSTAVAVVKSYREHKLGFKEALSWSVQYSTDGGASYSGTKPSWLTSITPTSGSGGWSGETISATATRASNAEHRVKVKVSNSGDSKTFDIVIPEVGPFGGLWIAPGPLMYENGVYVIKDNWNYDSYGSAYSKNNGSTYFNFVDMGQLFEKSDFSTSDGDIENLLDPLNGWRMPTNAEWCTIVTGWPPGTSRTGATVNGNAGSKYAIIQLTGVTHTGTSTPAGLLLFPDGITISGKTLSGINNNTMTSGVTLAELQAYLDQGCAFLPSSGIYNGSKWSNAGYLGAWWSATECVTSSGYRLAMTPTYVDSSNYNSKSSQYNDVRLVR